MECPNGQPGQRAPPNKGIAADERASCRLLKWFRFARGLSRRASFDAFGATRAPAGVVASGLLLLALAAERHDVGRTATAVTTQALRMPKLCHLTVSACALVLAVACRSHCAPSSPPERGMIFSCCGSWRAFYWDGRRCRP